MTGDILCANVTLWVTANGNLNSEATCDAWQDSQTGMPSCNQQYSDLGALFSVSQGVSYRA